jgi:CRISPR system Cascade subunit CasC
MTGNQEVPGRRRRSSEEVKRLVLEFEASGRRQNKFCRNHGLALSTLRRQLKKRRLDKAEPKQGGRLVAVELAKKLWDDNSQCSRAAEQSKCGRNSIRTHWNDFSAFWKGPRGVFGLGPATRIYLAVGSTDLRKGFARENYPNIEFVGVRSRRLIEPFVDAFTSLGLTRSDALEKTEEVRKALSKIDSAHESMVTTAVFISPNEVNRIAKAVSSGKSAKEAIKNANIVDAADIALFGRMIANDPSINVEAASMFSHALSVHKSTNDLDFFTAVDERYSFEGAASMGTLEFNASIYYRYTGLNIDLLERHLKHMSRDQRVAIVDAFIRSVLLAVPGARRTSMNGDTLPGYALGLAKKGRPLNLSNAFLKPCKPEMDDAVRALTAPSRQSKARVGDHQPR